MQAGVHRRDSRRQPRAALGPRDRPQSFPSVTGAVTGVTVTTPEKVDPMQRALSHWAPRGAELCRLLPVGRSYRTHKENEDKGLDED